MGSKLRVGVRDDIITVQRLTEYFNKVKGKLETTKGKHWQSRCSGPLSNMLLWLEHLNLDMPLPTLLVCPKGAFSMMDMPPEFFANLLTNTFRNSIANPLCDRILDGYIGDEYANGVGRACMERALKDIRSFVSPRGHALVRQYMFGLLRTRLLLSKGGYLVPDACDQCQVPDSQLHRLAH